MDNIIAFGIDVSSNNIKQISTINNVLLAYNIIGGTNSTYISGNVGGNNNYNLGGTTSFTVPVAGNYVINICASGYSSNINISNLQIDIWINGVNTNRSLKKFTNEINSHKTLVPLSFKYSLKQGTNTISLRVATGTIANQDDYASFNWVYSPS
jgi:hypothetical protein